MNKTALLIFTIFMASCSSQNSIEGTYYHLKGEQKYYTLTVSNKKGTQYLKFEGVPLDIMNNTPWNHICKGKGSGNTIKCDKIVVNFESNNQIAHVIYSDRKEQTFISGKKQISEEITEFKKVKE